MWLYSDAIYQSLLFLHKFVLSVSPNLLDLCHIDTLLSLFDSLPCE